jgi:hypothetical protein
MPNGERRGERGFTYLGVLLLVALAGALVAGVGERATLAAARERDGEVGRDEALADPALTPTDAHHARGARHGAHDRTRRAAVVHGHDLQCSRVRHGPRS